MIHLASHSFPILKFLSFSSHHILFISTKALWSTWRAKASELMEEISEILLRHPKLVISGDRKVFHMSWATTNSRLFGEKEILGEMGSCHGTRTKHGNPQKYFYLQSMHVAAFFPHLVLLFIVHLSFRLQNKATRCNVGTPFNNFYWVCAKIQAFHTAL